MQHFDDDFYLITPLTEETHVNIYNLELDHSFVFPEIFHKYLNLIHYLTGVGSYPYKEINLSLEKLYL